MKNYLVLALIAGTIFSCGTTKERLIVSAERANCTGVAPQKCLKVKTANDKDWTLFYSNIEGLDWEPGYEYVLEVDRIKLENVPADASSEKVVATKVVEKKYVGQELKLDREYEIVSIEDIPVNVGEHGKQPTMKLDGEKISGSAGCNGYFAGYTIDKNVVTAGPVGSTMMLCSDEAMKVENKLLKLLEKPVLLEQVGDGITIWQDGKQIMELK